MSDYFYSPIATMGSKVRSIKSLGSLLIIHSQILITSAEDFPDTTSGSLIEKLVPIGVEANLELTAQSIFTVLEAKKYSIAKVTWNIYIWQSSSEETVFLLLFFIFIQHTLNNVSSFKKIRLLSRSSLEDILRGIR